MQNETVCYLTGGQAVMIRELEPKSSSLRKVLSSSMLAS